MLTREGGSDIGYLMKARVLVVKLSSLGDILHALPVVHCLRLGLDARIDWVTQTEYTGLVAAFPDVERAIGFPRRGSLTDLGAFARELRTARYDLAIDLQGLLKSAFVTRLARARHRIGPSYHREGSRLFYHEVAGPANRSRHALEQAFDVVAHLSLPRCETVFPISLSVPPMAGPRPWIALAPFSRWQSKNWPLDRFDELARRLWRARGGTLFLVGAPDDAAACEKLRGLVGEHAVNMAGRTNLVELAGLLSAVDLLVSNDSGPMHLAAAVGTPVLALFGPTDPGLTGPWGARNRVLTAPVACRPCRRRACGGPHGCMRDLAVETVEQAALDMLGA